VISLTLLTVVKSSNIDGVHIEEKDHEALGKAVAEIVKRIL
jgi:lysophospholipase L1-like esterase